MDKAPECQSRPNAPPEAAINTDYAIYAPHNGEIAAYIGAIIRRIGKAPLPGGGRRYFKTRPRRAASSPPARRRAEPSARQYTGMTNGSPCPQAGPTSRGRKSWGMAP